MTHPTLTETFKTQGATFASVQGIERVAHFGDFAAEYEAARQRVAVLDRIEMNALRIAGASRVDFLQRQTTNDLKSARAGQAKITVLTNPQARILDVLTVLVRDDDFLVLNGPPQRARLARYLQGMIFFMDQVTVTSQETEMAQLELLGPEAASFFARLTHTDVELERFAWKTIEFAGATSIVVRLPGPAHDAFRWVVPSENAHAVWHALANEGATPIGWNAYNALRVESGIPEPGLELTDDVTPLEAGLSNYISATKGCYTGQEIIARQLTYDKVTRQLCGLQIERMPATGAMATLSLNGRQIGLVTSVVESAALQQPVALGYVRREHAQAGTRVDVIVGDDQFSAVVSDLPFR